MKGDRVKTEDGTAWVEVSSDEWARLSEHDREILIKKEGGLRFVRRAT